MKTTYNIENIKKMLQPKEYDSKIRLYCNKCEFKIEKHGFNKS